MTACCVSVRNILTPENILYAHAKIAFLRVFWYFMQDEIYKKWAVF